MKKHLTKNINAPLIRKYSSFTYLNVTQFLGALNDNIYKLLSVFFLLHLVGLENSPIVMASTGATFVLPFLLFSAPSGMMADRFSKRNVIIFTKLLELVIVILGVIAFACHSIFGTYAVLFLLATQSALFGPSKYGIIPELVEEHKVNHANGLMTSFTFLAIILGTFLASFLLDITGRHYQIACLSCLLVALIGVATSFCIEYTEPSGSTKRFNISFMREIYSTLKIAKQDPSLLMAIFGSAFFLFLCAFVQLNLIPYAVQSLHLTDVQGGYLFLLTAVGIGCGSLTSSKISGHMTELGIVPIASMALILTCYGLDFFSANLTAVIVTVMLAGFLGGIYVLPLDAYIQVASPEQHRGQVVAATNFLSFFGVLCASFLIYLTSEVFGLEADKGFSLIATLMLVFTVPLTFQYFDYLTRFVAMLLCRMHFITTFTGQDNIPKSPAIYICHHTAWNDTLLLLGSQRYRMRFFIEQEQEHSKWLKCLYRLLRIVFIPEIEPFRFNAKFLKEIEKTLDQGISVCLFVDTPHISIELEKLRHSPVFKEIFPNNEPPFVLVEIAKGEKEKQAPIFTKLLNKCRVPAAVSFGLVSMS